MLPAKSAHVDATPAAAATAAAREDVDYVLRRPAGLGLSPRAKGADAASAASLKGAAALEIDDDDDSGGGDEREDRQPQVGRRERRRKAPPARPM